MLTRDAIRSGMVRRLAQELAAQGQMRLLSDEALAASRRAILAGVDRSAGIWLFGYGSLIWNPAFHFVERQAGTIFGYHRRFCLWTHLGRGCPERPGLVLGLERGGACRGVAYRIAPAAIDEEVEIVWRREMVSGAYRPTWLQARLEDGQTVRAIAFVINRSHERYAANLPEAEIVEVLATARGALGACADYLIHTVDHLRELGIRDRPLERMRRQMLARQTAAAPDPAGTDPAG
jgi:cation transport protein ChaC